MFWVLHFTSRLWGQCSAIIASFVNEMLIYGVISVQNAECCVCSVWCAMCNDQFDVHCAENVVRMLCTMGNMKCTVWCALRRECCGCCAWSRTQALSVTADNAAFSLPGTYGDLTHIVHCTHGTVCTLDTAIANQNCKSNSNFEAVVNDFVEVLTVSIANTR